MSFLPPVVTALKCVGGSCVDDMTWESVPRAHDSLAEVVSSHFQTTARCDKLVAMASQIIIGLKEVEEILYANFLFTSDDLVSFYQVASLTSFL